MLEATQRQVEPKTKNPGVMERVDLERDALVIVGDRLDAIETALRGPMPKPDGLPQVADGLMDGLEYNFMLLQGISNKLQSIETALGITEQPPGNTGA
jgi:hypothetical protein